NRAEAIAGSRGPAAVPPRADHQVVQFRGVVLLERAVDPDRAVEVFLVPPAGDAQRRHLYRSDLWNHRLPLPELVVVGMGDEVVPRRDLAVEVVRVDVGQRSEAQIPAEGVVGIEIEL